MRLKRDQLGVMLKALRHAEGWRLRPRVARALLRTLADFRPVTAGTGTILHVNGVPVESRAFARYLGALGRMARGARVPLVVHVSVTDRCNQQCGRCSNRAMRDVLAPDPERARLLALLAELKAAGTVSVAFTGGEPLLRDDLGELVAACGPEMAASLFTSGEGLTPERARDLRAAGLCLAAVSLDDYRESVHDDLRGVSGAYRGACEAIRCFLEAGVYTAAQAVAGDNLLADRSRMEDYLRFCATLGVHEVVLLDPAVMAGRPGAPRSAADAAYLMELHRRAAADRSLPKVTAAAFMEGGQAFGCLAGYSFFHVTAAGELCPCDFVPLSFGAVFDGGLAEALGRAGKTVPRPCRRCLALHAAAALQGQARVPAGWEDTQAILAKFDGGEPAAAMESLVSGGG